MAAADVGAFEPSVWGNFFGTYTPPVSQRSVETMRERADELKGQVRRMFEQAGGGGDGEAMSAAHMLMLVDALERLGIDNHFRPEIAAALRLVHREDTEFGGTNGDLHVVALRFRLLRQHGLHVPADVFDKFKDDTGCFSANLSSDVRGLLSLYNAAHMAFSGEETLDDAIAFSRRHLESMKGKLKSPMAEQVSRDLDIPLPRTIKRLETMCYIAEYEKEEEHNGLLLELARLDFHLVRSLHLKELKALSLWWKDLYDTVKLRYARDRLVECYFWICGVYHEEEYSLARILSTKTIGLLSLVDDTYDVHGSLEDCYKLNEALQRWDESAVTILPEYLRVFYMKLVSNFKEFEDSLAPNEKYHVSYTKKVFQLQSKSYLDEAKWSNEKHTPSFEEHMEVSMRSSTYPMLAVLVLMGTGDIATRESFEWAIAVPDAVRASGEAARFFNDIASYKLGSKNKKDVSSSIECYMKEHGVSGAEAAAAIATMVEGAWRTINRAFVEMDRALLPAAQLVVNLTRILEVMYLGGRDGYTFGSDIKDLVTALFLEPVSPSS